MKSLLLQGFLFVAACSLSAEELIPYGILGQSQPEGTPNLMECPAGSTAGDAKGNVFFINGNKVYQYQKANRSAKPVLNMGGVLRGDGKSVYLQQNTRLFRLKTQENGTLSPVLAVDFLRGYQSCGIVPEGTVELFGKTTKFFAYDGKEKKVFGWNAKGNPIGSILDLKDFKTKGRIVPVGIMPKTGYLLVGTEYPDMKVYRFRPDGSQAIGGIWPKPGWINHFSVVKDSLFGVFGNAVRLEETMKDGKDFRMGDGKDQYANSVSSDGEDGFFIATTQGLKHYTEAEPNVCDFRLGGTGKILSVALKNGAILASAGNQLLGLNLDDFPDSPFQNTGNEPWHVGGNWSSIGISVIPDGNRFLILDSKGKTLWSFDPSRTGWRDRKRIEKLDRKFTKPTDLAYAGDVLLVADDGKINLPNELNEKILKVDAFGKEEIVAAGNHYVAFLKKGKVVWKKEIPVQDIAVIGDLIVVAGNDLMLFNKGGKEIFKAPYLLTALSVDGKWLVGVDRKNAALLKFKLK